MKRGVWQALGPGILFAGAAVGVSHLVQSTRAGAGFGVALAGLVVLANLMKYPAFRFGPQYAAATGRSLLQGYRRQGRWALGLYVLLTVGTMLTVQAAVTVVTAGLFLHLTGIAAAPWIPSAILIALCVAILGVGRFAWLDRVTKVAVGAFTVATLVATALALPHVPWSGPWWPDLGAFETRELLFLAALIGWMPSAIDISVWQSLWTLARARTTGHAPTVREAMIDFHVGYLGAAVLALCFLFLGAAVLRGHELDASAAGFAAQLVSVYAETLGAWSRPLVGTAAFLVMFSTTITVVDGFPRALDTCVERFRTEEEPLDAEKESERAGPGYWVVAALLAVGSVSLLAFAGPGSLKSLIDLATTLSFLTAPLLSILNHRAMLSDDVPAEGRPSKPLEIGSLLAIVAQLAFAGYYLWLQLAT